MTTANSVRWALSRVSAVISLGIGMGSLLGYVVGFPALLIWSINCVPMALPTAVAFIFLSASSLLKTTPP